MTKDDPPDPKFEVLLDYIKCARSVDLTGYKRASLKRRVLKRMHDVDVKDFVEYVDYLELHQGEFTELFNTILINVTSFFRDEASWDYLKEVLIPLILKNKRHDQPIRVWSAACASGQEAYSLAMLFGEAVGFDQVKIYATDLDEEALGQARAAIYRESDLQCVTDDLKKKYFSKNGSHYSFNLDARRTVIFGRHDLVQDAPISKLDLLVCRNTMMYLNSDTQNRILARLHFALNDPGYLFLGKAELMLTRSDLFKQVDLKHRIFKKISRAESRDYIRALSNANQNMNDGLSRIMQLKDVAIETSPTAQLILDNDGLLLIVNKAARNLFSMNEIALGSPFHDLELSYKPVELRSLIRKSLDERKSTKLDAVKFQSADGTGSVLSVSVVPLLHNGNILGVSISFFDMTAIESLQNEFEKSSQELETVNEELQSAQEELETTNEELQSTNEELETTNEELQSTNEELETMNEELQSTNEELETINNELRSMSGDLNTSNDLLSGILASLDAAVIALGPDCEILLWNDKAVDFWGVRPEEVQGKSIFGLDIGLPVEKLKKPISSFLKSKEGSLELPLAVTNRRGKKINCKVKLTRLADSKNGLVLLVHQLVD